MGIINNVFIFYLRFVEKFVVIISKIHYENISKSYDDNLVVPEQVSQYSFVSSR